jgi:hypothetical protein
VAFGVKAAKPAGKTGAQGCPKFLDFMLVIICNGNQEHFEYLRARPPSQKRSGEIALDANRRGRRRQGFYEEQCADCSAPAMLITSASTSSALSSAPGHCS